MVVVLVAVITNYGSYIFFYVFFYFRLLLYATMTSNKQTKLN